MPQKYEKIPQPKTSFGLQIIDCFKTPYKPNNERYQAKIVVNHKR